MWACKIRYVSRNAALKGQGLQTDGAILNARCRCLDPNTCVALMVRQCWSSHSSQHLAVPQRSPLWTTVRDCMMPLAKSGAVALIRAQQHLESILKAPTYPLTIAFASHGYQSCRRLPCCRPTIDWHHGLMAFQPFEETLSARAER